MIDPGAHDTQRIPHVLFLCWGNICRSPMGAVVAAEAAERSGVPGRFSSAGVSDEEHGNPMDSRAMTVLADHSYRPGDHTARQVTPGMLADVDLVIAAEQHHLDRLQHLGVDLPELALVSDFDPEANPGDPLPDPWYGGREDFEQTLAALVRSMPGLLDRLRELN
ncbi:low molecular weight protein-tyrosine-phosphatase [Propionibacteriaceae bacterium G1746]|uniref:low molecular weight protein-tyrosine-phosphatase n=1 Tax=Aestuariimicrobium sp. G57 TaxID=3418485 RepID=UPI003C20180B